MSLATADLHEDTAALHAFALACQSELKAAQLAVQVKALEIEKLRFQIAKLRRMQFGRSSERITRAISFHNGDEYSFIEKKWIFSTAC